MDPFLQTRGLAIGHRDTVLAEGLDLSIHRGRLCALIGVNGSGKSTLLRTLAGLHAPLAGEVRIDGASLRSLPGRERARRISMVFTGRPDAGSIDVATLVSFGRHPWTGALGRMNHEDRRHVDEAMELAGAGQLRGRWIHSLSDGEMQKVMIARALAQHAPAMLLDEPTAFLDLSARVHVVRLLHGITRRRTCAVLFSTHDLQLALDLADQLLLLRPGGSPWQGTPREAIDHGVLAAVFDDPHVRFDPGAGVFRAC